MELLKGISRDEGLPNSEDGVFFAREVVEECSARDSRLFGNAINRGRRQSIVHRETQCGDVNVAPYLSFEGLTGDC